MLPAGALGCGGGAQGARCGENPGQVLAPGGRLPPRWEDSGVPTWCRHQLGDLRNSATFGKRGGSSFCSDVRGSPAPASLGSRGEPTRGAGSPGREARGEGVRVAAGSGPLPPPRPGCARSASLAAKRSGKICGRTSRGSGARTPARSEQRRLAERELSAASGTFSLFLSEHRPPHTLLALAQPREAAQSNCCCNATPAESFSVPCTQCHLGLNVPDFLYSSGPWFSTNDAFAPRGPSAAPGGRPSGRHTWGREAAADT